MAIGWLEGRQGAICLHNDLSTGKCIPFARVYISLKKKRKMWCLLAFLCGHFHPQLTATVVKPVPCN